MAVFGKPQVLFLHVGHDKTGSTALQQSFSASRSFMGQQSVVYPAMGDDARLVNMDEMVPCGNARHLLSSEDTLAETLGSLSVEKSNVLFSSELVFEALVKQEDLGFLSKAAEVAGFSEVRILLFIRDPLPHAVSVWQQRVKGWQGESSTLDQWMAERYDTPLKVCRLIKAAARSSEIKLSILRYETVRHDLHGAVEQWVGLRAGSLVRQATRVNRSLTGSEVALQRILNEKIGPSGKMFAFRLVSRLPDLPADPPRASSQAQMHCLKRLAPVLDELNAHLPEEHRYSRTLLPAREGEICHKFTSEQLEIIAEGIAVHNRADTKANRADTNVSWPRRIFEALGFRLFL